MKTPNSCRGWRKVKQLEKKIKIADVLEHRLPQPLDCSNLAKEWPKWKQQFHIYMIANNKNSETKQNKLATFLWLIGDRGVEIYNTLFPNNGDVESMFGAPAANVNVARQLYVHSWVTASSIVLHVVRRMLTVCCGTGL